MFKSCINLDNIRFTDDVRNVIIDNKKVIVKQWIIYPTLFDILTRFDISHEYYENNVATPVLEYFITIIEGQNKPGDCPVMRKVVDLFYEKGFKVEDVFLSCTAFKNVLNKVLIEKDVSYDMVTNLMMILDMNLSNILAIYSQKLEEKEEQILTHKNIIEDHVLLTVTNSDGIITYVTGAFCELSGFSEEELIGKTHNILSDPEESQDFFKDIWETITTGDKWEGKIKNFTKEGMPFILNTKIVPIFDKSGTIIEYMAIRENITDREIFQYDSLTNAYTRRIFDEKFDVLLDDINKSDNLLSVVMTDIDFFKKINDTYGHQKGDEVLKEFTHIILRNIRNNDMCFRWGGEEFVILLPHVKIEIAQKVAQRIRKSFNELDIIEGKKLSASFGVTQYKQSDTKDGIVKRADDALYTAKQTGRNKVEVS